MRPPVIYYGGKTTLAGRIVDLLPDHTHYVEPFAGSLAVLLAKTPSRIETVNDLDGDLMMFWRVLRDRPMELAQACALTPHSRAERELARHRGEDLPELERARRVWVCLTQGRTGTLRNTGWRFDTSDVVHTSMPRRLSGYVERLTQVATRLAGVSLECRPALDVIAAYGSKRKTLLYVDPPYLGSVRERNYRHEMQEASSHRALAEALHQCAATVVVSGYASDLYDQELYAGWHRCELDSATSQGGLWKDRVEVLWSNRPFKAPAEQTLEFRNNSPVDEVECNETCEAWDCRKTLRQPTTGRRRRYCSTACRVRAHRASQSRPEEECAS
jgi:DNA adenine methylase